MAEKFEHFLITRFNVPLSWAPVQWDQDWLKHRIQLFEDFCFPSVQSQANQNFRWLVLFDSRSPEFLKKYVEEKQQYNNFVPVFVDAFSPQSLVDIVMGYIADDTDYVITTRMDNDDAISFDFIDLIQNNFEENPMVFLNILLGCWWHDSKLYQKKYPKNPFISLIEKIDRDSGKTINTVYCGEHTKLDKLAPIKNIDSKPAWMIVVHEKNILNERFGIRTPISKIKDRFGIARKYLDKNESGFSCFIDKLGWLYARIWRAIKKRIYKNNLN
ncbi:MAG: hypothetical protein JEZ07_13875 [Phycisphaerae bacterium]|nr:hypothetical protein [Phycisphaerae bacterium]